MNKTIKPGYIMVFTLIVISLSVSLITNLVYKSRSYIHYMKTAATVEKAKLLALSGLEITKSQLAIEDNKTESTDKNKKNKTNSIIETTKTFIKAIVPTLNYWQTFKLSKKIDGINGEIKLCIMSEEGKINLNEYYTIKNKKFSWINENAKKRLQYICLQLEQYTKEKKLFNDIENYLKKRKNKLYDLTELLTIKKMNYFNDYIFYKPIDKKEKAKSNIYLTDIFTLSSKKDEINPWLFSESIKKIMNLKSNVKIKKIENSIKNLKVPFTWPNDWDTMLSSLYNKKFNQLPKEVNTILTKSFEPKVFSVLSYGIVENIIQKLFIIIERVKQTKNNKIFFEFKIKKLYWL